MTRLALVLTLVLAACGTPVDDHEAILDAMLAELASSIRMSGPTLCVAPVTDAGSVVRQVAARDVHPDEEWYMAAPGTATARRAADPALSRAANAVLRETGPVRPLLTSGRSLPGSLRSGRLGPDCQNAFALSYPSIQGDFAFVEEVNSCGSNCFGVNLYAFRRERGAWRVHAFLPLLVT